MHAWASWALRVIRATIGGGYHICVLFLGLCLIERGEKARRGIKGQESRSFPRYPLPLPLEKTGRRIFLLAAALSVMKQSGRNFQAIRHGENKPMPSTLPKLFGTLWFALTRIDMWDDVDFLLLWVFLGKGKTKLCPGVGVCSRRGCGLPHQDAKNVPAMENTTMFPENQNVSFMCRSCKATHAMILCSTHGFDRWDGGVDVSGT